MRVDYEWDIETVTIGDDPEVLDHWHVDTLDQFPDKMIESALNKRELAGGVMRYVLVLVRTEENGYRSWAYVDQFHKLPLTFYLADQTEHVRVPQRFIRELKKYATAKW